MAAWVVELVCDDGHIKPIGVAESEQDAICEKIRLSKELVAGAVLRVTEYQPNTQRR
jgi:hypothetical protein